MQACILACLQVFACGHVFGMRACIWHAGIYFAMQAFILACGHVFGMQACILACWHMGMYLACGHVFGMRAYI